MRHVLPERHAGTARGRVVELERAPPVGAPVRWRAVVEEGRSLAGVRTDTMLSAYLLDPAGSSFELQPLSEQYLGTDVLGSVAD